MWKNNIEVLNAGTTGGGIFVGQTATGNNPNPAIAAQLSSSNSNTSAVLGDNIGAGYGVTGQISPGGTGFAGVLGTNARPTGGVGVNGIGYNGVYGETLGGNQSFGVRGDNASTDFNSSGVYGAANTVGVTGIGFAGIRGQTTDVMGWAGYFEGDVNIDGDLYIFGAFVTSDERLKKDIKPINNALDKLVQVNGKHYSKSNRSKIYDLKLEPTSLEDKLNNERNKTLDANISSSLENEALEYGLIAQEIELIFPEMVSERALYIDAGDETKYKAVNYVQLIPVMIEAIKELKSEVDELQSIKDELELLKREIQELKKK